MKIIAIIPARGGSKGIPEKNIYRVAGKPLVVHSIKHALNTVSISRVFVSTDSEKIKKVSQEAGAEVIDRPAQISGDEASSESALLHALDHLKEAESFDPDLVVFLQATSPLRRSDDLEQAIQTVIAQKADSLFSACLFHSFIWREEGSVLKPLNYDYTKNRPRRQDCPPEYMENGSFYIFKPSALREGKDRLGGKVAMHCMSPIHSFQIDSQEDLNLVEHLFNQ